MNGALRTRGLGGWSSDNSGGGIFGVELFSNYRTSIRGADIFLALALDWAQGPGAAHDSAPGESFLVSRTRAVVGKQRGYLALLFASWDDQKTRVSGLGLLYGHSFLHIPVAWRILLLGVFLFKLFSDAEHVSGVCRL